MRTDGMYYAYVTTYENTEKEAAKHVFVVCTVCTVPVLVPCTILNCSEQKRVHGMFQILNFSKLTATCCGVQESRFTDFTFDM
jgi:hypothetical protein